MKGSFRRRSFAFSLTLLFLLLIAAKPSDACYQCCRPNDTCLDTGEINTGTKARCVNLFDVGGSQSGFLDCTASGAECIWTYRCRISRP